MSCIIQYIESFLILFLQDKLGLKEMDAANKVHFLETQGNHLQFSDEWLIENIIHKYF